LHPIGAASLRDDMRALESIQENVMPERLVSRAATTVSLIAASLALGSTGALADCLPGPGQAAANGHWYYRIDHANNRKCWYLAQSGPAVAPEADGARPPQNRQAATRSGDGESPANKHVASRLTEAERSTLFHEFLLWKERQKP
jgi:hypothetical protein